MLGLLSALCWHETHAINRVIASNNLVFVTSGSSLQKAELSGLEALNTWVIQFMIAKQ
jgi:hypothetical protein